jgi:hypothetical protein
LSCTQYYVLRGGCRVGSRGNRRSAVIGAWGRSASSTATSTSSPRSGSPTGPTRSGVPTIKQRARRDHLPADRLLRQSQLSGSQARPCHPNGRRRRTLLRRRIGVCPRFGGASRRVHASGLRGGVAAAAGIMIAAASVHSPNGFFSSPSDRTATLRGASRARPSVASSRIVPRRSKRAADGERGVGPLTATPLVRGRGTVLGTHKEAVCRVR